MKNGVTRVTNGELLTRCYSATHEAAEKVSALELLGDGGLTRAGIEELRKLLREGYCAAQELKTRLKDELRIKKGSKS